MHEGGHYCHCSYMYICEALLKVRSCKVLRKKWYMQITRQITLKYTKKTQKNTGVQFNVLTGNCRKLLSSIAGNCRKLLSIIRRGEVPTLPIQRVGLTPDVPCLQCTLWMQVWVGVDD